MRSRYPWARASNQREEWIRRERGTPPNVFFFFSNRFGCLGSIMLSIVLTVILMAFLRLL